MKNSYRMLMYTGKSSDKMTLFYKTMPGSSKPYIFGEHVKYNRGTLNERKNQVFTN